MCLRVSDVNFKNSCHLHQIISFHPYVYTHIFTKNALTISYIKCNRKWPSTVHNIFFLPLFAFFLRNCFLTTSPSFCMLLMKLFAQRLSEKLLWLEYCVLDVGIYKIENKMEYEIHNISVEGQCSKWWCDVFL